MMNIFDTIERLIEIRDKLEFEHPNNSVLRSMLLNLEELQRELHQANPDKEKIHRVNYGFLRTYEEMANIENRSFHEEVENLLLVLNSY